MVVRMQEEQDVKFQYHDSFNSFVYKFMADSAVPSHLKDFLFEYASLFFQKFEPIEKIATILPPHKSRLPAGKLYPITHDNFPSVKERTRQVQLFNSTHASMLDDTNLGLFLEQLCL